MNKNDTIIRATAAKDQFRIIAVDSTRTVQEARDLHDLSPLATLLLGRLISATAMMGMELKTPGSSITLNLQCEGALKGALVICEYGGKLRAYAKEASLFFENAEENLNLKKYVGKGTISITKDIGVKRTNTGICELVSGEIAEDIAHYYTQSEQIPSAISLGVLFDKEAQIRSAGGFLIQQMPNADRSVADQIIQNINNTPNLTDLMDMGYQIEQIVDKFILKGIAWEIKDSSPLQYYCPCNKERFERALITLGKEELITLTDGIDTVCSYCNKTYTFSEGDISALIDLISKEEQA